MIKKRLLAFLIDFTCLGCLLILVDIICIWYDVPIANIIFTSFLLALFFCRDSFTGKSLGRTIIGIIVVDSRTLLQATPTKTILRNLFLILWPVEFIAIMIHKQRLGDVISNTTVIDFKIAPRIYLMQSILAVLFLWILISMLFILPIHMSGLLLYL